MDTLKKLPPAASAISTSFTSAVLPTITPSIAVITDCIFYFAADMSMYIPPLKWGAASSPAATRGMNPRYASFGSGTRALLKIAFDQNIKTWF